MLVRARQHPESSVDDAKDGIVGEGHRLCFHASLDLVSDHREREPSMKTMTCPCGATLTGATDEEFVDSVNQHFAEAHPEMSGKYTAEQILSRAQEV